MYACLCADKVEDDIKDAIKQGITDLEDLMEITGIGTGCGTCRLWVEKFISEEITS